MYKMDKKYNFHISREERQAIELLREHDINISRFLRMSLRNLAEKIRCQTDKEHEIGNDGGFRYDKTKKAKLDA